MTNQLTRRTQLSTLNPQLTTRLVGQMRLRRDAKIKTGFLIIINPAEGGAR